MVATATKLHSSPELHRALNDTLNAVGSVLLGKPLQIRLALCCLCAGGHLLLEDLPGMGKTTLAQALAKVLGLEYKRVQFTSDLLPADILGVSIFDRDGGEFKFLPGPVFTQLLLADEINRATPKTQSALLEAMAEGQVSVEGLSRPLPAPFFVVATQNPATQSGTYPLPESQLDRFFMRLSLGYPDPAAERRLLLGEDAAHNLPRLRQCLTLEQLASARAAIDRVHVADALLDYVQRLVAHTRTEPQYACGLSPRGALALLRAARGWALLDGRGHVLPEDVQMVLAAVVEHRLQGSVESHGESYGENAALTEHLLRQVPVT